jgi:hypothetical protein
VLYGFFSTTRPFSHTTIGVPYMRAIFRARRAAAGMARFTESKNRSLSGESFRFFMGLVRSIWA